MLRSGGIGRLVDRVHTLDLAIDAWVDQVRNRRSTRSSTGCPVPPTTGWCGSASARSSAAWHGAPEIALRLGASMGVESALTNGPIKLCFQRVRPVLEQPHEPLPYGMHRPITSSFPSGHSASAFTAAVLLAGGPLTPAYFVLATGIAFSRRVRADAPHVRHRRGRRARCGPGLDCPPRAAAVPHVTASMVEP